MITTPTLTAWKKPHSNEIHRLITQLVVTAHRGPAALFGVQMELRLELRVVSVPLPMCLELVNRPSDDAPLR